MVSVILRITLRTCEGLVRSRILVCIPVLVPQGWRGWRGVAGVNAGVVSGELIATVWREVVVATMSETPVAVADFPQLGKLQETDERW